MYKNISLFSKLPEFENIKIRPNPHTHVLPVGDSEREEGGEVVVAASPGAESRRPDLTSRLGGSRWDQNSELI